MSTNTTFSNELKEKGPSYFSLDDGYGKVSSLTKDEKKRFSGTDDIDDIIKMQKYDNKDNLLMTIYSYDGKFGEFRCDCNNGMTISYAHASKQSSPIEAPEMEYIKWIDGTDDYVILNYNVGDTKEETKKNFLAASRKQGVSSIKALKIYGNIRETCDFQKEGIVATCRDGHYSHKEFLKYNTKSNSR